MRDVRFGSYSTAATLAGMPNFSRRKSIRRYRRLCPPPCQRLVMWPLLLRPPVRRNGSSSDFSGSLFVTSAKSETERNRVPGVIGRNCRMPISALEHGDRVAFFERDDRLLPRRATARPARGETAGAAPGAHHQGAHVGHGDLEQRLDRRADLWLGRGRVHAEGVLFAGLVRRRGFLGDDGAHDQPVLVRHRRPPPPLPPLPSPAPRFPPAPAAPPPPHPPTGSRTPSRPRTASRARRGCSAPRGRRCTSSPRRP